MTDPSYKRFTETAKRGIRGEAFFESLVCEYAIPHKVVGAKDVGVDFICEWVYGDRPSGILFAVQVKTVGPEQVSFEDRGPDTTLNQLRKYTVSAYQHLQPDDPTFQYWRGLGLPFYVFLIVDGTDDSGFEKMESYYRRYTTDLTSDPTPDPLNWRCGFYKANRENSFLAFADPERRIGGFARDLFIDHVRWSYFKGAIAYVNPRTLGLEQFPEKDAVFADLFKEYRERILKTYAAIQSYLFTIQDPQK